MKLEKTLIIKNENGSKELTSMSSADLLQVSKWYFIPMKVVKLFVSHL